MEKENNPKSAFRHTMPYILFGALIGILLGIAGVLIYQGYLGQITNILLYVSLVFFGVVVLTFKNLSDQSAFWLLCGRLAGLDRRRFKENH